MANRADERKFHYIYKITRTDGSGKYYIGMHSTDKLEDGYFGSGMLLWKSINRHGKEKHSKEILEFLPNRESLKQREKFLVNTEILDDPRCMNLRLGGEGGGGFRDENHRMKFLSSASKSHGGKVSGAANIRKCNSDPASRAKALITISEKFDNWTFGGKTHSAKTKAKIGKTNSIKMAGSRNSNFGKCWVSNETQTKTIKKELLEEYLNNGYIKGMKLKASKQCSV